MHYAAQRNIAKERIIDQQVSKLRSPAKFGILSTIDGVDVIDNATGRPVAHRESAQSANGIAQSLNAAASKGTRALAVALGSY